MKPSPLLRTLASISLALATGAAGAMDIPTYELQRKTPAQSPAQTRMRVYLLGVGEGLKLANAALVARGERPLYCVPGDTLISVDDYLKMIDAALPAAKQDERQREQSVESLVLRTLQARFGCGGADAGPAAAASGPAPRADAPASAASAASEAPRGTN